MPELRAANRDPSRLRSQRWFAPDDLRSFGHRSRLRQMGYAADEAEGRARDAAYVAAAARRALMKEEEAARAAEKGQTDAEWAAWNAERRTQRALVKAAELQARVDTIAPPTQDRTVDEWTELSAGARRQAALREREHLKSFFSSHTWRMEDLAEVLH